MIKGISGGARGKNLGMATTISAHDKVRATKLLADAATLVGKVRALREDGTLGKLLVRAAA